MSSSRVGFPSSKNPDNLWGLLGDVDLQNLWLTARAVSKAESLEGVLLDADSSPLSDLKKPSYKEVVTRNSGSFAVGFSFLWLI